MQDAAVQLLNLVCTLACCGVPIGLLVWLAVWLSNRKPAQTPPPDPAYCSWLLARMSQGAQDVSARLLLIVQVYQCAQRGSKAFVQDYQTGERFDTWFWWRYPQAGSLVLAPGSFGHGEHHDRTVFYVGDEDTGDGVLDQLTAEQLRAAAMWGGGR